MGKDTRFECEDCGQFSIAYFPAYELDLCAACKDERERMAGDGPVIPLADIIAADVLCPRLL